MKIDGCTKVPFIEKIISDKNLSRKNHSSEQNLITLFYSGSKVIRLLISQIYFLLRFNKKRFGTRPKINRLTVTVYAVVSISILYGCYSSSQTYKENDEGNNPYQSSAINPKIVVYNFSNDSSTAYIKIYTSELLYKNDSTEFDAHVRIEMYAYEGYAAKSFLDSTSITFLQPKIDDDKSRYVIASLVFKKPLLTQYLLKFMVMDLNRGNNATRFLSCNNNDNQNQFSMMAVPLGSEFPSFENHITSVDTFHVFTKSDQPDKVFVRYFAAKQTLAAPPHSNSATLHFSYTGDSTYTALLNKETVFNFTKNGIYHFQFDTLKKSGYTLLKFNDDFPKVARAEEMTPPLRYLTTIKEYNNIINAKSTAEAIEGFWVERAGNKDRARKLISAYYGRMEEANRNFTSYTEGWRTDRGMIYMILGRPVKVQKTDKKEVWTYSNIAGTGALNFEFTKMFNPFTENDFILIRSQLYELPWYTAVNTWREGNAFGN
ncbi:MAG: GWxTD domain-containing protein [Bacteroidia bacterium]